MLGVGLLLVAFRLVDELLPSLERAGVNERARWYVGPWTMFGIGLAVAFATLSVAVALSILVPAVARGYLRREQTLPYIAGANITTLVDTLFVGILTGNADAPRVVLAVALAVSLVSVAAAGARLPAAAADSVRGPGRPDRDAAAARCLRGAPLPLPARPAAHPLSAARSAEPRRPGRGRGGR